MNCVKFECVRCGSASYRLVRNVAGFQLAICSTCEKATTIEAADVRRPAQPSLRLHLK